MINAFPLHCAHVQRYYYNLLRSRPKLQDEAGIDEIIESANKSMELLDRCHYEREMCADLSLNNCTKGEC